MAPIPATARVRVERMVEKVASMASRRTTVTSSTPWRACISCSSRLTSGGTACPASGWISSRNSPSVLNSRMALPTGISAASAMSIPRLLL
ncbi:hypothetical protein D3C74_469460 [compost metagenome]